MNAFTPPQYEVDPDTGCHIFQGRLDRHGYGRHRWGQEYDARAHRVAYEFHAGPIPHGLVIDHLCRRRNCINPDHMEVVAPEENTRRGESFSAVNARKTHCDNGHPFSDENTYIRPTGGRTCRECNRLAALAYANRMRRAA